MEPGDKVRLSPRVAQWVKQWAVGFVGDWELSGLTGLVNSVGTEFISVRLSVPWDRVGKLEYLWPIEPEELQKI